MTSTRCTTRRRGSSESANDAIECAKAVAIMAFVVFVMGFCGGIERGTIQLPF